MQALGVQNKDLVTAKNTIEKEIEALKLLECEIDESLTKALDVMVKTKGRIIITGMGKSGIIGKKIVASLASTGTPSFFVHPAEAAHGDLGMLTNEDTVLAISNSGESKELADVLNYCKRFGINIIGITKNPNSSLGKASNIVLKLPDAKEACPLGLAPTSSTTATLVLGDILTVALMERRAFTKSDFNERHPGGKLGAVLLRVSDLMHTKEELPLLSENTSIQEAIIEMTSKRLGCVGFVDKNNELTGILTDGDLRRCMSSDVFNKKASNFMTRNPKTIIPQAFASEAIKVMNENKITNLFVLEDKKPIGVIHIHDCLSKGIA